jgi:hypothetical protein
MAKISDGKEARSAMTAMAKSDQNDGKEAMTKISDGKDQRWQRQRWKRIDGKVRNRKCRNRNEAAKS